MTSNPAGQPMSLDELRAAVASILNIEPEAISDDANLLHLGLDSLSMMRLVTLWRRQGVRVSSRNLAAEPTLAAWHQHVEALRQAAAAERLNSSMSDAGDLAGDAAPR